MKGYKKGQKHKTLLLWIQKLESMQTILASEEQWGEMVELKKDQFEIDFEKLREDISKIRDLLKQRREAISSGGDSTQDANQISLKYRIQQEIDDSLEQHKTLQSQLKKKISKNKKDEKKEKKYQN